MQRVLVVYYSLTEHTRQVAEAIASACGADIERISDVAGRQFKPSSMPWLVIQALLRRKVPIRERQREPAGYDLVIIGTPVWAGSMTPPVRTYIEESLGQIKQLATFCTEGGANGERALKQVADLAALPSRAQLIVTEAELKSGAHVSKTRDFVKAVGLPLRRGADENAAP
jgi:flavodoxin